MLTDNFYVPYLASSVTVRTNDAVASIPQNLQFKEQSENQNFADSADEILHHLKLKNMNRLLIGQK